MEGLQTLKYIKPHDNLIRGSLLAGPSNVANSSPSLITFSPSHVDDGVMQNLDDELATCVEETVSRFLETQGVGQGYKTKEAVGVSSPYLRSFFPFILFSLCAFFNMCLVLEL